MQSAVIRSFTASTIQKCQPKIFPPSRNWRRMIEPRIDFIFLAHFNAETDGTTQSARKMGIRLTHPPSTHTHTPLNTGTIGLSKRIYIRLMYTHGITKSIITKIKHITRKIIHHITTFCICFIRMRYLYILHISWPTERLLLPFQRQLTLK